MSKNAWTVAALVAAAVAWYVLFPHDAAPVSTPASPSPVQPAPAKPKLYLIGEPNCPWCEKEKGVLSQPAVKAALARFDFEESDDPALASRFGVRAFPTWVEADAAGAKTDSHEGYMDAGQLAVWLAKLK